MQLLARYCLVCLLAFLLAACGNKVELMSSMPESDANEVLATLSNAGIGAKKISGKEGMVGLSIDAADVGRAVDLLRTKGIPRERYAGMGDIFKKEGLISSPLEERARYIYALSQELRGTLALVDGVLAARVHVVLPERGSAGDPSTPSSAAVFIKHQEGYNLDSVQPQIRKLVINSIPSLTTDKVTIVLFAAQAPPASAPLKLITPAKAASETPASKGEEQAMSTTLLAILLALLVLSLGATSVVLWKFWWPTRKGSGRTSS